MKSHNEKIHNKYAPYWAVTMFALGIAGLSTLWVNWGAFWNGYVLDITGPAWNYILFRGLFTANTKNVWTRFFTPHKTFFIFLVVCFGIEGAQYLELYDSTFDPWDLVSYSSILIPLYILDLCQLKYYKK